MIWITLALIAAVGLLWFLHARTWKTHKTYLGELDGHLTRTHDSLLKRRSASMHAQTR